MPPAAIKRIVAAKPVRCDVCGLTILVGDEYDRWVNQEHGKVISEAGHVVCRRIGECVAREWRDSSWNMGDGNVIDAVCDWMWQDFQRWIRGPAEVRIAAHLYKASRRAARQYPEWALPPDVDDAGPPTLQVIDGQTGDRRTYVPDRGSWGSWKRDRREPEE